MICVSIARGRHRFLLAELRHLGAQGVGLVELRLDCIQSNIQLKRLLTDRPCPVIATCRRRSDGGYRWQSPDRDDHLSTPFGRWLLGSFRGSATNGAANGNC